MKVKKKKTKMIVTVSHPNLSKEEREQRLKAAILADLQRLLK